MYKIVKRHNDKFYSYNAPIGIGNIASLEYKLNEWTYPQFGKLFVFNTLKNARNFIILNDSISLRYSSSTHEIYKCEILGEPIKLKMMASTFSTIQDFWRDHSYSAYTITGIGHYASHTPVGTRGVDGVKLIGEPL